MILREEELDGIRLLGFANKRELPNAMECDMQVILREEELDGIRLLVFANKRDLPNAM